MIVLGVTGIIHTNTPAFQTYAFHAMFTNASFVADQWHLNLGRPLSTNSVTDFKADAQVRGLQGRIVFQNRYAFIYRDGKLASFADTRYLDDFLLSDDKNEINTTLKKWMNATNLLSLEKARKVAEAGLSSVGIPPDKIVSGNFPVARQEAAGENYRLPYFIFEWKTNHFRLVTVAVSGITGHIAEFENRSSLPERIAQPANYFEMLGLPKNAIFVKRKWVPSGMPQEYMPYQP